MDRGVGLEVGLFGRSIFYFFRSVFCGRVFRIFVRRGCFGGWFGFLD